MIQRYNDKRKKPKPGENQLGILEFTHFAEKFTIWRRVQESTAGVTIYL